MKVAFVSQPFEYVEHAVQASSIAIWTDRVIRAMKGYPVQFLVYARQFPGQARAEQHDGVAYRRVSTKADKYGSAPLLMFERILDFPLAKRPFFSWTLNYLSYAYQIARDLRAQQCDIVHIHNFSQFVPVIKSLNPNIKIILHMQCDWLAQLDFRMIEKRLEQVDMVLGCSEHVTQDVARRFPWFAGRCHTVYNGVDASRFSEPTSNGKVKGDAHHLLFVGRVSPEKGIHVLLEAFKMVVKAYPNTHLDIVGPIGGAPYEYMTLISDDPRVQDLARFYDRRFRQDGYYPALENLVDPEHADRVTFTGPVRHGKIMEYFQQADILVNPSLTEAFGMSLVEAMAMNKPVVASAVGGMKNVIQEGENGLLAEPGNARALAEAILTLLEDDQRRRKMGETGRERVLHRYSWEQIACSLWPLYQKLDSHAG